MRTQTRSPAPCASPSRHCANGSANPGSSPPCQASATASTRNQRPAARKASMNRAPGLSVRLKLTLSYAGFLMLASVLLLAAVWVFLLRYVPDGPLITSRFVPNRSDLLDAFVPRAAAMLAFLLLLGLVGGWLLAGR